jgi:hypothetical protein
MLTLADWVLARGLMYCWFCYHVLPSQNGINLRGVFLATRFLIISPLPRRSIGESLPHALWKAPEAQLGCSRKLSKVTETQIGTGSAGVGDIPGGVELRDAGGGWGNGGGTKQWPSPQMICKTMLYKLLMERATVPEQFRNNRPLHYGFVCESPTNY